MNKLRWKLSMLISRLGWLVMPEPQRSRCAKDFADALLKIRLREEGSATLTFKVQTKPLSE